MTLASKMSFYLKISAGPPTAWRNRGLSRPDNKCCSPPDGSERRSLLEGDEACWKCRTTARQVSLFSLRLHTHTLYGRLLFHVSFNACSSAAARCVRLTSTQTSPYLMTGILAECCTERVLSDSNMEKKGVSVGGISGHFSIVQFNTDRTKKHRHTYPYLFYDMFTVLSA